jgi:hypothetical protein
MQFENGGKKVTRVHVPRLLFYVPMKKNNSSSEALMKSFQGIFKEPKNLPPIRTYNHNIPIKERAQPINLRLYRYYDLQKDTLEEIIYEMIKLNII